MTTKPRTELRAEGGQVRFRAGRAPVYPAGQALEAAPSGGPGSNARGDQCQVLHVYRRTHSAFLTALAYALTYLPRIAG